MTADQNNAQYLITRPRAGGTVGATVAGTLGTGAPIPHIPLAAHWLLDER